MDKKLKKRLGVVTDRLAKRRQQLAAANDQPDDPQEIANLKKEIADLEKELQELKQEKGK